MTSDRADTVQTIFCTVFCPVAVCISALPRLDRDPARRFLSTVLATLSLGEDQLAKASMTLDVYGDLFDDDLDAVAVSLDAAIAKASKAAIAAGSG
jgi:hypothetical protein